MDDIINGSHIDDIITNLSHVLNKHEGDIENEAIDMNKQGSDEGEHIFDVNLRRCTSNQ